MSAPRPRIVHEDEWIIVVDKPPALVVHPAPGHSEPTLVEMLAGLAGGSEPARPGVVHRLDKDTSGLLVLARSDRSHAALSQQVEAREMAREYIALVEGRVQSRAGTIEAPVGRSHRDPTRMAVAGRAARVATTHFEVLEVLPFDTLLTARLETGRTHQIRVHFASIGHPVAGDPTYGRAGRHGLERQFLHSHRLGFRHPADGRELSFASELPGDLERALARARDAR